MMNKSTLTLSFLEDSDKDNWNACVRQSSEGNFFHKYEWLKLLEEGLGLKPFHIVVKKGSNIIGGFPNFVCRFRETPLKVLSSIPVGYGGPVVLTDRRNVLDLMFGKINEIEKDIRAAFHNIVTANLSGYVKYSDYFSAIGYHPVLTDCKFVIELSHSYEEIRGGFSNSKRRNIRQAEESPISIREMDITIENLKIFYEIYEHTMERVGGVAYPFSYFGKIVDYLMAQTKLFMARKDTGENIAGLLHFTCEEDSTIYYFFGACYDNYFKYRPNELLHQYSIKWGIEQGYKFYDMGGTSASFESGFYKFKEQWGGKVYPNLIWYRPSPTIQGYIYRVGSRYNKPGSSLRRLYDLYKRCQRIRVAD
jgi:predicted N-acyltransferase